MLYISKFNDIKWKGSKIFNINSKKICLVSEQNFCLESKFLASVKSILALSRLLQQLCAHNQITKRCSRSPGLDSFPNNNILSNCYTLRFPFQFSRKIHQNSNFYGGEKVACLNVFISKDPYRYLSKVKNIVK